MLIADFIFLVIVTNFLSMVSIYSLFLGSFFFTFGAWIEELLVKDQIEHLTKEFVSVYHIFIGDKSISSSSIRWDWVRMMQILLVLKARKLTLKL